MSVDNTHQHPFRRAVLRGLGVVMPLLLTIVFLLWIWNSVQTFVLLPVKNAVRSIAVNRARDVLYEVPPEALRVELHRGQSGNLKWVREGAKPNGTRRVLDIPVFRVKKENETVEYCRLPTHEWIPYEVFDRVRRNPGPTLPETAEAYFRRDVETRWFRPSYIIPLVFCAFILTLYLLGKIIAARIGRAIISYFEQLIDQVPLINSVYSTLKKVTDIMFGDHDVEFNRVVAVQYPRRDMWSLGFVTGESLPSIRDAAGEPLLSVLMPTSPMPATGFTISVRKSETLELDISVDQAFQFIVSCGVVIPSLPTNTSQPELAKAIEGHVQQTLDSPQSPTT